MRIFPLLLLFAATFFALIFCFSHPPRWKLDMGNPTNTWDEQFSGRFSVAETVGSGAAETTFRWSVESSRLILHGSTLQPHILSLRLFGDERAQWADMASGIPDRPGRAMAEAVQSLLISPIEPWQITVLRQGHANNDPQLPIATYAIAPRWRTYHLVVPPEPRAEPSKLFLESNVTRELPDDHRQLGVPVDWVGITPLSGVSTPWWPPLRRAFLLTWLIAVVAWGYNLLDRGHKPFHWRVFGLTAIMAAGVIWWAWQNPYTLAWALPSLPWTLAGITLLLFVLTPNFPRPAWQRAHGGAMTWLGLIMVVVGHGVLFSQTSAVVGAILALSGIAVLSTISPQSPSSSSPSSSPPQSPASGTIGRWQMVGWMTLIVAVALGMRLYQIETLPYGLWRDEARHGLIALRILEEPSYRPIYVAAGGVNMPALGFYPFALALKWWGVHTWSLRMMTALVGALTVLPFIGFAGRLQGQRAVALLGAGFLAISSWHITMSRFSFPSIFEPFLALLGLWLLIIGLYGLFRQRFSLLHIGACAGAGLSLGVALQNYHTGRVVPLIAGIAALLLLLQHRALWRRWLIGVAAGAIGFTVAVGPLVNYAITHPDAFNSRVGGVFLLSEDALRGRAPLAALDDSIGSHMLMFNMQGDSNGRHHAPNHPMLDAVAGLGFLVGVAVVLRRRREWWAFFLMTAIAISLLPSLLAVQGPHAMRSIGAIPYVYLVVGLGWVEIWCVVGVNALAYTRLRPLQRVIPPLAATLIVIAASLLNAQTYFVDMVRDRAVWLSSYPIHTQVGAYMRKQAEEHGAETLQHLYLQPNLVDNSVLDYLTHGLPVRSFDDADEAGQGESNEHDEHDTLPKRFLFSGYVEPADVPTLVPDLAPEPVVCGRPLPDSQTPSFLVYQKEGNER